MRPAPPRNESELMERALSLAGCTLGQIAGELGLPTPPDLRRDKGWIGQLLELQLGATAASLPRPDFPELGIELKTLPVRQDGQPRESTYVCTVDLINDCGQRWQEAWVHRKLAQVLWMPVQADRDIALADRRLGSALLWRPDSREEAVLRDDWEELMEMICTGRVEQISARHGVALQIRPKAAHSRVRCEAIGADGRRLQTNPRGFYLRTSFTRNILASHFAR